MVKFEYRADFILHSSFCFFYIWSFQYSRTYFKLCIFTFIIFLIWILFCYLYHGLDRDLILILFFSYLRYVFNDFSPFCFVFLALLMECIGWIYRSNLQVCLYVFHLSGLSSYWCVWCWIVMISVKFVFLHITLNLA